MTRPRILLLSPYDAGSHRGWREGLCAALPDYDWTVLNLPPRFFNWRIRGNSLSWALGEDQTLHRDYELLIATSMTDLASLRGLVPGLGRIPAIAYFHENQFAYPAAAGRPRALDPCFVNLYTALAADRVVFNSEFNRDSFMAGAAGLLAKMPDAVPGGVVGRILARSEVLAVPIAESFFVRRRRPSGDRKLTLVWNHRWEHDKAPERLLSALDILDRRGVEFRLHLLGQKFRRQPDAFNEIEQRFAGRLAFFGYAQALDYAHVLSVADVVLSTALQDFQGMAVLEAVAGGCLPVVPDRLAYREIFAAEYRYLSAPHNPDAEARALADRLVDLARRCRQGTLPQAPDVGRFAWSSLAAGYRTLFEHVMQR